MCSGALEMMSGKMRGSLGWKGFGDVKGCSDGCTIVGLDEIKSNIFGKDVDTVMNEQY